MILLNAYEEEEKISPSDYRAFLTLLNPFAPHLTEELNEQYHLGSAICESTWPKYDPEKLVDETKIIAVQVNGKVRATIEVHQEDGEEEIKEKALKEENVQKHINGKEILKTIIVKDKIVNIVVK